MQILFGANFMPESSAEKEFGSLFCKLGPCMYEVSVELHDICWWCLIPVLCIAFFDLAWDEVSCNY